MLKKFSILGDSVSTLAGFNPEGFRAYYEGERGKMLGVTKPGDTWWGQVIRHFNGELLANASFSGSLVEGGSFPAGDSDARVAALACGEAEPDVVVLFMGINDYGWGGMTAQVAGHGAAVPSALDTQASSELQIPGLADAQAAHYFEVAYDSLLRRLGVGYPQAEIWCCTLVPGRVAGSAHSTFAYCLRGVHFDCYNQAIRNSAQRAGCTLVDLRAQGRDYEASDGTHPTARGMRQLASMVIAARGQVLGTTAPAAKGDIAAKDGAFSGAPFSAETCNKPACVGCDYAASTSNQWLCVCKK